MILRSLLERGRTWSLRRKMEERRARERGGVERWDLFPPQACWSADATVTHSCEDTQRTGCSDVLASSECAGLQSCKCKWMHLRVSFAWWCFRWIPSLPNRYLGQKTDEGTWTWTTAAAFIPLSHAVGWIWTTSCDSGRKHARSGWNSL